MASAYEAEKPSKNPEAQDAFYMFFGAVNAEIISIRNKIIIHNMNRRIFSISSSAYIICQSFCTRIQGESSRK
jgi:hypothetical protein